MASIHELTLAAFVASDATDRAKPGLVSELDMGALRLAYGDQWRTESLSPIPGRDGRYSLAVDWFATAVLLVRKSSARASVVQTRGTWEIAGLFSENLLLIDRPHRGALLSAELQIFGFQARGGRVGRLPPYTPVSLVARRAAYRLAIRRAIVADEDVDPAAMRDYRCLVADKKRRDETGSAVRREIDAL